jgi:hypothetical protein
MPVVREKASKPGKERKVTDALNTTAALRTTTKKVGSLRCKVKGLSKLSKGGASKAITSPSPRQHVHCLHFGYRRERIMSGVCFKFNTCVLYQKTNIKKKNSQSSSEKTLRDIERLLFAHLTSHLCLAFSRFFPSMFMFITTVFNRWSTHHPHHPLAGESQCHGIFRWDSLDSSLLTLTI